MDKIAQLKSFLKLDPSDSFTKFALALEYQKTGNTQLAENYFVDILESDPDYVGVYYHLGKLYEVLNNPERAAATYTKGLDVARINKDTHAANELAEALLNINDD